MGSSKKSIPQHNSSHDEGVHPKLVGTAVMKSSKIAPLNLAMSFTAEEESEENLDHPSSPWASNEGLYKLTDN